MFSYLITLGTKIKRDVVQTWGGKHPRMTYGETSELQCKREDAETLLNNLSEREMASE